MDFKTCFIVIVTVIFGMILGISLKDRIYTEVDILKKKYKDNKKPIFIYVLIFLAGLLIGIVTMLILKANLINSLSGWISGIGTWAAVVVSFWLATGRKSRLKINHGQSIDQQKHKEINFIAYNLSDISMSLKFYGIKKPNDELYQSDKTYEYERVKAGEYQARNLGLDFIKHNLKISDNYKGDIISCFAEPDGNLHCEVINWKEEMLKFEKLRQKY